MLDELLSRLLATHPAPNLTTTVALALVAVVITWSPIGYPVVRHLLTLVHEAGHAAVALLCGRRLSGVRLHSDTSGVTVSKGRTRGPGMVLTVLAGYPAPAVLGLAGALALTHGHASAFLWALVLLSALMLVLIRNLYGLWVVLVLGLSLGALSWLAPGQVLVGAAHLMVWTLLLGAPRAVVDLARARRRPGGQGSDADQAARLTHLPAVLWVGVFLVLCLAALGVGGHLLVQPSL